MLCVMGVCVKVSSDGLYSPCAVTASGCRLAVSPVPAREAFERANHGGRGTRRDRVRIRSTRPAPDVLVRQASGVASSRRPRTTGQSAGEPSRIHTYLSGALQGRLRGVRASRHAVRTRDRVGCIVMFQWDERQSELARAVCSLCPSIELDRTVTIQQHSCADGVHTLK